ncbi:MAG: amidase, partial [Thermoproteota archaeon]
MAVMAERALGLLSATELLSKLRDREVSSRELLAHFTQRRATYNDQLNAIVTVDDEAAERAALAADEQLVAGAEIPPLLGLP